MLGKTAGLGIVLALATGANGLHASLPPHDDTGSDAATDVDSALNAYKQAQHELFDSLRNDASPRRQVLAGRLYVDDEDMPTALRPKREDVVAGAARLARNDAVVQWIAADSGSYYSSQCGPTRWPEAEVAALLALEPDNAGALQYAVALAHAKGDRAALDEALARMAAAARADDHFGDEVAEWRKALASRPAGTFPVASWEEASPEERALLSALQRAPSGSAPTAAALESVCKPDGEVEQSWQRLGRCIDAGTLLAGKGSSFALRETGLRMLAATGATPGDLVELQRQVDWLKTNAANPLRNSAAFGDSHADLAADWRDTPSEIVATERRLKRLGEPATPPAGWVKTSEEEDVEESTAESVWQEYLRALLDDMRRSADVRAQALALASDKLFVVPSSPDGGGLVDARTAKEAPTHDSLAALAATNPDDLLLQWIVATSNNEAAGAAIAAVQRLDSDNAAAWGLSLPTPEVDTPAILQRMAEAKRYDEHFADLLDPWLAAIRKRPMPAESLIAPPLPSSSTGSVSADTASKAAALGFAMTNSTSTLRFSSVHTACKKSETGDTSRKNDCAAIGRLMLNSGRTAVSALIGAAVLREVGPLDPSDQQRARRIYWWHEVQLSALVDGASPDTYFEDFVSTGDEIEALRLAATRIGKAEPPAEWKSPPEKRAEKGK